MELLASNDWWALNQATANTLVLILAPALGINLVFWSLVGCMRLVSEATRSAGSTNAVLPNDVAVVIPAHNEEASLPTCLAALLRIVQPDQIYVASDGSSDGTVAVALAAGCHVLDIQPNAGKAKALKRAVTDFALCDRYQAVLIQDADSEIDPAYLQRALPLFDDPKVAVVAGHVLSRWQEGRWSRSVFTAYRTRLYRLVQMTLQYGQTWWPTSVTYIAPGFTSMYRSQALRHIDITAPGLVIEDFNMTFEVQHKRLGRVAYTPTARCSCEDPARLGDYVRQIRRWYLGLWQTVWRHGIWPGKFWAALGPLLLELLLLCTLIVAMPIMLLLHVLVGTDTFALATDFTLKPVPPIYLVGVFIAVDYATTVLVALIERRPSLLAYGFLFPAIRVIDAAVFLMALFLSFRARSDGRWKSPARRAAEFAMPPATRLANGDAPQ